MTNEIDDEIIFNNLNHNSIKRDCKDAFTVDMDNYTDILKNSYTKHRDDLYDKIDQILFGLKENEYLIYLPNQTNVISIKKSECSRYKIEYGIDFKEHKKYEHINLLEILCEYSHIKNEKGIAKTEWITLTEYTGSQFQKKTIIIEGI